MGRPYIDIDEVVIETVEDEKRVFADNVTDYFFLRVPLTVPDDVIYDFIIPSVNLAFKRGSSLGKHRVQRSLREILGITATASDEGDA